MNRSHTASGPARDLIGYGPNPVKTDWPGGAAVAVQLVVNYEEGSENSPLDGHPASELDMAEVEGKPMGAGERDLAMESMYEYGSRVGIWRLMRMFQSRDVPATAFACAVALERNPMLAEAIVKAGYDICCHGYRWEEHCNLTEAAERERIEMAVESITRTTGHPPDGWYCRYGPSVNTRRLVAAHGGFLYDTDAYNDDLPYWTQVEGKDHLVIPYTLDTNDLKFTPGGNFGTGDAFFQYLRETFDQLVEEAEETPRMMSVGLHPRLIGRPGRLRGLQRFVDHALDTNQAWFCRRIDIARHWIEHHPPSSQEGSRL